MKISHKLFLLVICITCLTWLTVHFALISSQATLKQELRQRTEIHALLIMERVVHELQGYRSEWRRFGTSSVVYEVLHQSNEHFSSLPDKEAYIEGIEERWRPNGTPGAKCLEIERSPLSEHIRSFIGRVNKDIGFPLISEAFFTNRYGAVVAQSNATHDFDQRDEKWWSEAVKQGSYYGPVYYDKSMSSVSLPFGYAVKQDGQFLGVLKLVINLEEIATIIASSAQYDTQQLWLFDEDGNVIGKSKSSQEDAKTQQELSWILDPAAERSVVQSREYQETIQTLVTNAEHDSESLLHWKLLVEQPKKEFFAPLQRVADHVELILLIVTLTCTILGLLIVWSIIRRLHRVQRVSQEIREGNRDINVAISGSDEIAELLQAIIDISNKLESVRSEMESLAEVARKTDNGVIVTNSSQQIEWINEGFSRITGYSVDELLSLELRSLFCDEALLSVDDEDFIHALQDENDYHGQLAYRHKDSSSRWLDVRLQNVKENDSGAVHVMVICSDITEHMQVVQDLALSHDALLRLQTRFDRAVQGSSDALWDWNLQTNEVWYSPQFQEVLQVEDSEDITITPYNWKEFVHQDDWGRVITSVKKQISDDIALDIECRCLVVDKGFQWFRIRGKAHRNDDGVAVQMSGSIQDISVGRSLLDALDKERQEARIIFDNIPSYVFYKDDRDTVLRANNAAASFTGIDPKDMVGQTFAEMFPSMGDYHYLKDQELFTSGNSKLSTIDKYINDDTSVTWVRTDRVLVDDEEERRRLLVVSTDITELKEAEDRIRESEARMELALRAGEMGIWEWNLADNSIVWDRIQTILLGIPEAPLHVDSNVFVERVHKDDVEALAAELRRLIKDQDSSDFHVEFRIHYPTGELRWIAGKGRGIFDASGWATGIIGVIYDITDHKDKERQIQRTLENQKVLNSLLEISFLGTKLEDKLTSCLSIVLGSFETRTRSVGGIFIQSSDEQQDELIAITEHLNDALVQRLRFLDEPLVDRFPALQTDSITRMSSCSEDVLRPGGSQDSYARFDIPLMEGELRLGVMVLFLMDVEELTELEQEYLQAISSALSTLIMRDRTISALREARELAEQGTRAKSAFLASMSHELRTPLNSIMGFTQRLLKRLETSLSDRDFDSLLTVDRNAKHLLHLINDILDLSKIEAGKVVLMKREFNLIEEVRSIIHTLTPLADAKNLPIHPVFEEDEIYVFADKTKLIQIVTNLLSNAIKYTDEGSIQVAVHRANARAVSIAVADTGIGIREEDKLRLFTEFTQLGHSESRRRDGTGLGLTITREYVEMHGGEIEVQSEWQKGTRCLVLLPILLSSGDDDLSSEES